MRTDILSFVMASENRKGIAKALFEYPRRQWSCTAVEEATKLPHATVFRALKGLAHFGILKQVKINKKDIIYELASSVLAAELERAMNIDKIAARGIAMEFINKIKHQAESAVLYGSSAKGSLKPESDVDILVVADKVHKKDIFDAAAGISQKSNRTISPVVVSRMELNKEKKSQFMRSVKENMEVLYGKSPF
ncbi:nucleotidyltransferase domain-containing protein [Candidatus Woesearchaeota archaeon]|nr:nucleotidyltransferase domain-containing protein [Candidatus Woesearchaeota archaeon]